jgi:hypothetical protein
MPRAYRLPVLPVPESGKIQIYAIQFRFEPISSLLGWHRLQISSAKEAVQD